MNSSSSQKTRSYAGAHEKENINHEEHEEHEEHKGRNSRLSAKTFVRLCTPSRLNPLFLCFFFRVVGVVRGYP
jgi:hypothetical protein